MCKIKGPWPDRPPQLCHRLGSKAKTDRQMNRFSGPLVKLLIQTLLGRNQGICTSKTKNKKQKQALQLLASAKFEHHRGRPSISKPLQITTGNQMALNHCLILESKVASGTSHTGLFQGLSESAYGGPRVVLGMEQVLSSWKLLAFLHSAKTY